MSTKMFFAVLLTVLVSAFLVAKINFNVTEAVDYGSLGTPVGGIIWENTTWNLEGSPYLMTATIQIPDNVTLTIEPGVTVAMSGYSFLTHGRIYARGTVDDKILFDGGKASRFFDVDGSSGEAFVDLDYCIIKNGGSFWSGGGGYCSFSLKHSELINVGYDSYVWYPAKDIYIEFNKFVNSAGFSIHLSTSSVYIRHNVFKGDRGFVVEDSGSSSPIFVKYNSFIDMAGIVLQLTSSGSAAIIATENYWGTNNTEVIDSMIYDRNDDILCAGFIEYLPILNEHHPDTPIMLEDVMVEINGIFKKDYDSKWKCYANATIKNNSWRNVTISWVYLNVVNITYVDETFEELDISGNETLNYVIQPEQELYANWTITESGFTKEPKILWVLFKTPISEACGTITLTTVIPEFPSILVLPLFMIATLLAVTIYRRKRSV